jgi:hypothetical protein
LKKVLVGLALALALGAAVLYGYGVHARHWFPYRPARDLYRRLHSEGGLLRGSRSPEEAARLARRDVVGKLSQLPYLQGYNPASSRQGVTLYDPDRAYGGWNLCVSAHAAQAQLLDMRGVVHHRWAFAASRLWPGLKVSEERFEHDSYWNRALLLPGGDLLVVWEYIGMARLDRGSRLKWAVRNAANHDLAVDREGRIYTLTRRIKTLPEINPDAPVFEDFVTILSPEGKTLQEISLYRSFEGSDYAPELAFMADEGDIFHANAVQVLDGALAARNPAFRGGNLLVSICALGIVAVLDPRQQKIVWALSGQWRAQHTPRLLESGRILMFDNFGGMRVGQSRVLEIDPFTQEIVWHYGDAEQERIFSESHGVAQRLPNGDTLIVESNNGRAIEVTPQGEVVWEYVNPYRAGAKKELVATLLQVERLDPRMPTDWVDRAGSGP